MDEAEARRAKLQALKERAKRAREGGGGEDAGPALKFRNYQPKTEELKDGVVAPVKVSADKELEKMGAVSPGAAGAVTRTNRRGVVQSAPDRASGREAHRCACNLVVSWLCALSRALSAAPELVSSCCVLTNKFGPLLRCKRRLTSSLTWPPKRRTGI